MTEIRQTPWVALALGALLILILWGGNVMMMRTREIMGSTFEFPLGLVAVTQLMWFSGGAVVGIVLELGRLGPARGGVGYLLAAAVFPLLLIATFWMWISPIGLPLYGFVWISSTSVQAGAVVSSGVLLGAAALRGVRPGARPG